jgi:MFS family permease
MVMVIAAVYLTAFLHSERRVVFGILFGAAGIALAVGTVIAADGWQSYGTWGALPVSLRIAAMLVMLAALGYGWKVSARTVVPAAVVGAAAMVLPWVAKVRTETYPGGSWTRSEPSVVSYALVAAAAVFLAWWGVKERSKALVNYGIAGFALTVAWFYFSSVMDKLGRSLGLIALGVLFLAGGWMLEKMRRRLIEAMRDGVAEGMA